MLAEMHVCYAGVQNLWESFVLRNGNDPGGAQQTSAQGQDRRRGRVSLFRGDRPISRTREIVTRRFDLKGHEWSAPPYRHFGHAGQSRQTLPRLTPSTARMLVTQRSSSVMPQTTVSYGPAGRYVSRASSELSTSGDHSPCA